MFRRQSIPIPNPNPENCKIGAIVFVDFGIPTSIAGSTPADPEVYSPATVAHHTAKRWAARVRMPDLDDPDLTYHVSNASLECRRTQELGTRVAATSTLEKPLDRQRAQRIVSTLGEQGVCSTCPYFGMDGLEAATYSTAVLLAEIDEQNTRVTLLEVSARARELQATSAPQTPEPPLV